MSTIRNLVFGCVSDRSQEAFASGADAPGSRTPRTQKKPVNPRPAEKVQRSCALGSGKGKISPPGIVVVSAPYPPHGEDSGLTEQVKFGVPLADSLKDEQLPYPLVDMLVYVSKEGVTTTDLFRKNGNPQHIKFITKNLAEGKPITLHDYTFHTLAAVIKRFLLKIPGGIFGPKAEYQLLGILALNNRMQQYDAIHSIVSALPAGTQKLLALLFGMWFRIVNHYESNRMSSEAVAKSVVPSVFHTCARDPKKIEQAAQVLQVLIDDFGVANMFGRKTIQYFADVTKTGISVREKYRYEFRYPPPGESITLEETVSLFARCLQAEANKNGFDVEADAITEEEFYGPMVSQRRATQDSQASSLLRLDASSPPSPKSLQQHYPEDTDMDYNPHKKLTHMSSSSAPEVNQGCDITHDRALSATKHKYLSTNLTRVERMRRRQAEQMKQRSNWFLTTDASISMGSEGLLGVSRDASLGKSSLDATSSDALASDVTASDGGLSDTQRSDALHMSDFDYSAGYDEGRSPAPHPPSSEPLPRARVRQDVLNANNGTAMSTPAKTPPLNATGTTHLESSSISMATESPVSTVTDSQVRYFMVENYYGNPESKAS